MLLITEALPNHIAEPLLRYNIRFVEQFLSMMRKANTARNLALVLNCSIEDLAAIAHRIEVEHPDLSVPNRSDKDYGLGYGKSRDWKRFSK